MDKFVIKTSRSELTSIKSGSSKGRVRQATLFSLPGVVSIDDIQRKKKLLESSAVSTEQKVNAIKELLGKNPSTEVLIDTGIGKTVRRLRKDSNPALSEIAEQCYTKWKLVLERRIELSHNKIEVKCDKETERLRSSSRSFLLTALPAVTADRKLVAQNFEKEIFAASKKLVNNSYRRLSRKVIFGLKKDQARAAELADSEQIRAFVDQFI